MSTSFLASTQASGTTATPARPAGVKKGSILFAQVHCAYANELSVTATGWTLLEKNLTNTTQLWGRIAVATEPASYTFTNATGYSVTVYVLAYTSGTPTTLTDVIRAKGGALCQASSTSSALSAGTTGDWLVIAAPPADTTGLFGEPAGLLTGFSYLSRQLYRGRISTYQPFGDWSFLKNGTPTIYNRASKQVEFLWVILKPGPAAPPAPALVSPANGARITAASGVNLKPKYLNPSGQKASAYSLEIKKTTGASYGFWNATTGTTQTTQVWNACSLTPTEELTVSIPAAVVANGNSYQWSAAFKASTMGGPFATPSTFSASAPPGLVITGPSGVVTEARPSASWTATPASGLSIINHRVVVFTTAQTKVSGFTPATSTSTWDSGVVSGTPGTLVIATTLMSGTYVLYVQVAQTGTEKSTWKSTSFTVTLVAPAAPTVAIEMVKTATTGLQVAKLTVTTHDNLLTATSAAPATGVGKWVVTQNCTLSHGTPPVAAPDGPNAGLELTASGAGTMSARTGTGVSGFKCVGGGSYTLLLSFLAASTARACHAQIDWYNATGALISSHTSSAVTDSTTTWESATLKLTAPAAATWCCIRGYVASAASGEKHWFAVMGVMPGTTTWGIGGFVGNVGIKAKRSDGVWLRSATQTTPADVPSTQTLELTDPELLPGVEYHYAVSQVVVTTGASSPAVTTATVETTPDTRFWIVDPLHPTGTATATPPSPGSFVCHVQTTPFPSEADETQGYAYALGVKNPILTSDVVHGSVLPVTFVCTSKAEYDNLVAARELQRTLLLKSGLTGKAMYFRFVGTTKPSPTSSSSYEEQLILIDTAVPARTVKVSLIEQDAP